jgi:hypothetical protein
MDKEQTQLYSCESFKNFQEVDGNKRKAPLHHPIYCGNAKVSGVDFDRTEFLLKVRLIIFCRL